jgi:hypothetical protein
VAYSTFELVSGATSLGFSAEGVGLRSVHTLRDLADAGAINDTCQEDMTLVLNGSSLIGTEVVAASQSAS